MAPPRLEVVEGDLTQQTVDAIVNAANEGLRAGGGVCGAIFAAAGPGLAEACEPLAPCPTGEARTTPGFALPARWIVHAVGPVWQGGATGEPAQLAAAYRSALEEAAAVGARSIAFPAISTGIYGYPLEPATEIAVAAGAAAPPGIDEVRFVCFDGAVVAVYRRILDALRT
ncbi:MAG: macro domain-containing protein [Actinomycetes bacterium]